jgi:hypothetical protein
MALVGKASCLTEMFLTNLHQCSMGLHTSSVLASGETRLPANLEAPSCEALESTVHWARRILETVAGLKVMAS